MSNYKNDAAFARGFDALSGLLNMFLQNKIQQDNVQDERDYQDKNYEKRVQDAIATNMYNNAVKGNGDLYRPIPKQTVAGHEFNSVANNPTGNVDTNDFQKLRNGELSYKMRPNADGSSGNKNNYRVNLDKTSADLINRVYKTNYKVGDEVPYSLFSGVSTMSNTQDKISNNGNITPKVAIVELNKMMKAYNPMASDEEKLVYMIENPVANELLQKAGLYNDALQKYKDIKNKENNPIETDDSNGFWNRIFGKKKEKEIIKDSQTDLRQQAISELQNQGFKVTEDNINKVISRIQQQ